MIYRPSDGCCGACEHPHRPQRHCCCAPICCLPWQPEFPQPPMPVPPRPTSALQVLSTVNSTPQTVAAGGSLPFTTNTVSIGSAISHTSASPSVIISVPGVYRVDFSGTISPLTTAELPDAVSVALNLNGTAIPGAAASETFTAVTDESSMSLHAIIEVPAVPATLTVTSPSGAVVNNAVFSVERLGSLQNPLTPTPYPYYPVL